MGGSEARTTTIWTGESGILVIGTSLAVAIAITWKSWPLRRSPHEAPFAELDRRTI